MCHDVHEQQAGVFHASPPLAGALHLSWDDANQLHVWCRRPWPHERLRPSLLLQVSGEKEFFANLVVDAVSKLDPQTLDLRMIGIKKVGGSMPTNPVMQRCGQYPGYNRAPKLSSCAFTLYACCLRTMRSSHHIADAAAF